MRKRLFFLVFLCFLLAAGCTQRLPFEPSGPEDSLLVGGIKLLASNFESQPGLPSINGEHSTNIEMTIKNLKNDEYTLYSSLGGFFYKKSLPPDIYWFSKLVIKITNESNSSYTLTATLGKPPFLFPIRPGKVVNLGGLLWYADNKTGETFLRQNVKPDDVKAALAAKFPKSAWFGFEWVGIDLEDSRAQPVNLSPGRAVGVKR